MGRSFLLGVALGMLILLGGCGRGAAEKSAPSGPAAGPPPVAPPTTPAPGMGSETSTAKTPEPAPGTSPVKPQATDDEAPVPDDLKDFFSLASSRIQSPEADDVPKILEALKHPRTSVRRQAAQTLSYYKTNGETIVPALIVALSDPHQSVGSDAARSLAQFGAAAEPGLPQLRKMLSSDEYFVRSNAINAIAAIGEKAKPAIPDLMKAGDREYTFDDEATEAVGKLGGVKELMALAEDKKDRCRRGAAAGLAQVRPTTPEIVAVLAKMMKDSEPRVRYSAARAFGKAEPKLPEAVPPLLMGLDDAEADVRQAAAGALGGYELEPKTKVQSLLRAMTGSSTGTMLNWEAERSIYQTVPRGSRR